MAIHMFSIDATIIPIVQRNWLCISLPHSPQIGFEQSQPLSLLLLCAAVGHGFAHLFEDPLDLGQSFFRSHGFLIPDAGAPVNGFCTGTCPVPHDRRK